MMSELPPKPVVFLQPDDFGVERVFPIRNLVGEDADYFSDASMGSRSLADAKESGNSTPPSVLGNDGKLKLSIEDTNPSSPYVGGPYPRIPSDETIRPLEIRPADGRASHSRSDGEEFVRRITERAQMVPTIEGVMGIAPGVMINEGTSKQETFYSCEDEPIHAPGAIQNYGALVALRYDGSGNLLVRIASENSFNLLKRSPEELFGLETFFDILGDDVQEDMSARIANAIKSIDEQSVDTYLDVFTMSIVSPEGDHISLWCAIHIAQGTKDLVICEFEPLSDVFYLDGLHDNKLLPKQPWHNIDNEVTAEEQLKSTRSGSAPLRVLQIARRKRHQAVSSMDIFNAMTQAQQQLASSQTTQSVLDTVVGLISELTGFHRVMFYRFDSKMNGVVDSELIDPKASTDFFRGEPMAMFTREVY